MIYLVCPSSKTFMLETTLLELIGMNMILLKYKTY